jgi:uncharacterized membrane protein YGL010W|tara:strand:+ start:115 stop:591 length:477 start_codon:yes stop_codon:yes gene_type:complete
MNKSIEQWLNEYGESHQNKINKSIHWVCVPLIMLSLLGLFYTIPFKIPVTFNNNQLYIDCAIIFLSIVSLFYFKLSKTLFVGMILISIIMLYFINILNSLQWPLWKTCLVIFIVSWIGQFIGHKIEGKKPSFFEDLQFLLIGPAWLLSFIYKKLNIPI